MELSVPCDARAPARVREALAAVSPDEAALGDAMLIASELVTNAVVHSGAEPTDRLDIRVERAQSSLKISVTDPGRSGRGAGIVDSDEEGFGGLGLRIVEELTSSWGEERDGGYRVWAELPLGDASA